MFDLGWLELILIGITALIVVGPKDLPLMFRAIGKFVGKAKGMAREFSQSMEDAADQSGIRDATKTLNSISELANTKKFPQNSLMKNFSDSPQEPKKKRSSKTPSNVKNKTKFGPEIKVIAGSTKRKGKGKEEQKSKSKEMPSEKKIVPPVEENFNE
tara:strand:+ start:40 stop:510 length:471 start_codon:yes stop_codon:yes gene_type:complete